MDFFNRIFLFFFESKFQKFANQNTTQSDLLLTFKYYYSYQKRVVENNLDWVNEN